MRHTPIHSHARSAKRLATFFMVSGTLHFLFPLAYAHIMPPWVPLPVAMVLLSGACEIAGGMGILQSHWQRAAGLGLIALSVAVFPANVQMLLNAHAADRSIATQALLLLRLPLQIPLIYWIWWTAVAPHAHRSTPSLQRIRK